MREAIKDLEIMKKEMGKHSSELVILKETKEEKTQV